MATITVRDLDDALKARLRVRAAQNGRSMEAEVRTILRTALAEPEASAPLGARIHGRFRAVGGVELPLPERAEAARAADVAP